MNILKNKYLIITVSIIALVFIFLKLLPEPIDMNLGKIGSGQVSVVFIYDPNLVVSNQQTIEINKARDIIGDKVIFLIAKVGDPKSEGFRSRYQASSKDLLFFNANGQLTDRKVALVSAEQLLAITSTSSKNN